MLVRLTSSTSGEVIMFAKHAHRLFEIIGKERTARGVFTKEQLPEAIARLHHAVDEEKRAARRLAEEEQTGAGQEQEHDQDRDQGEDVARDPLDAAISLAQRAQPVINLMEWTQKEEGFILWLADQDF